MWNSISRLVFHGEAQDCGEFPLGMYTNLAQKIEVRLEQQRKQLWNSRVRLNSIANVFKLGVEDLG